MNNSMNILKRMMAFLLAMLLLTTMMGDDFSSLADSDLDMVTETIQDGGAAADVETTEGETADTATPEPEVTEEVTEPVETEPEVTEPEVTDEVTNSEEINIDDSQNIDETDEILPEEEVPEEDAEEECEHDWKAVSNDDGTHTWVCTKCEEQGETEDCEFGEDGICIHCGYEQPAEEEECDHEWEYTSNDDGTHTKRCTKCGVEEVEDCQFDEDWVCKLCGYEDMSLEYQEYSKTIHGVKVTVAGEMPRKSKVTIYTKSLKKVNDIVNETIDEGTFEAYEAFDITIYDRHGDKYQPKDDGNSVSVTFEGVSELADTPDEEIVAYRIEDDQETVTEIPTDVAGEDVSFDAEHFSTYAVGTISTNLYASLSGYQSFAYIAQATANYTRVDGTTFYVYFPSSSGGSNTFTVTYYKGLEDPTNPTKGTEVATATVPVSTDSSGYYKVDVTFDNVASNDNAWVTKNSYYSVVVSMTSSCQVGYGSGSTKTYIKNASGTYDRSATYDGIFQENITTASTISDSYTVTSIAPANGTASSAGAYYYAKGETDTFTATLSADVDRTIVWTSSEPSVATIDENGKLTAVAPGTTTITGTYNSTSATATVNVISISLGTDATGFTDSVGSTASYSTEYTGSEIKPDVRLYTNSTDYLTTKSSSLTATFDNTNTEVTDAAHVKVSYKVDSKTTYSYDRYFKITAVDITKTDSSSKTAFDDAKYTISDGEITAVTNVNSNSVLSATPSFTNGDFTVTVNGTESKPEGIVTSLTIKGAGNFSGTVNVQTTIEGTDISDLFTVKITSNTLKDCYYTGADYALTATTDGWSEVTFYDSDGATSTGVITPETADVKIVNSGTTTEDAKNAGAKTIIFTMKSGQKYTGSISVNFTIQKASLNSVTVNWVTVAGTNEGANFYHKTDDSAVEPVAGTNFNVTLNGNAIDATEYNVTYPTSNHTDIGQTCTLYLSSKGVNFTSGTSKSETYYIIGKYANDLVIRITDDNGNTYDGAASDYATGYTKYYDGTADTPTINAYMPGVGNLSKTTDVTIEVFDNKACDTAVTSALGTKYIRVTPVAGGTYKDEATIIGTYTVAARPLTEGIKVTKSSSASSITFTGDEITLTTATADDSSGKDLTVKYGTTILTEGTDYEIVYSNNYNVGTASYKFTGIGNYTGTLESNSYRFTITQASIVDAASATTDDAIASILSSTFNPIYNGKQKTPNVEVKIGTTTIEQTDSNNSNKANYTVTYGENVSPGKGTVTVTGTNNLTGSVILPFTITSSTEEYSKITILNTPAVKQSESTTSGVVTRVYTCAVDMTYNGSYRTESYNVFGVDADTPLTEGTDYYAEYHNHKNAATYTVGDTTNSPYLEIIGLGSYANNNAIVYFTIKAKDISATKITYKEEQAYNSGTVVEPTFTIEDGTATLAKVTDYTVECFDVDSDGNKTTLTGNAGNKIAVITGAGNYSGTVEKEYTVGTDLSEALVTISSYYYTATTNEETWYTKATNNSSKDSPFEIYWRNSQAPIISLATTAGETITNTTTKTYYTVEEESSLGLTGANFYDARAAKSTTDSYNIITYKATGKPTEGYFGTATVYYRINPQTIDVSDARMRAAGSETEYYTGSDIIVKPKFIFTYKYQIAGEEKSSAEDGYSLELTVGEDISVDTNIGSKVGDNVTKTATGIGNYTGTQTLGYTIQAGYVTVSRTYNSAKKDIATTSKPTDTSATTPYSYEYDLSDSTKDYYAEYYYTGSDVLPDISITATNGTTPLTKGTDYTITYPTDAVTVGEKEIVINITGSNYVAQTITIKYEILSNSIKDFVGTVNDVTYTAQPLTISSIKASSLTLKNKAGVELTRGKDYALVTDSSELTEIKKQYGDTETSIFVTTSLPSYQTNYVFVKGLGTYSGYCKVPFNVVLDLSANGMSHVYFEDEKQMLADENSLVPVIKYKSLGSPNASTYDETLDSSFTYNSNTYNNYTITRGNAGNPGPDTDITVTGQYMCTGSATNVTDEDGDTICFLADLSKLSISLSTDVFDYTGVSINVLQYLSGIDSKAVKGDAGNGSGQASTGDYTITYKYKVHSTDSDFESPNPSTVIKAGYYNLVIEATDESDYYQNLSSKTLSFYVKYNLSSDDTAITFYNPNDGTKPITSISYTGSEYSIAQNTKVTAAGESIYDYGSSITSYVTLTPTSVTKIGNYTIKATAKDTELVYGSKSATFKVTSVGLDTATFTLYNPYDSSALYSTNPCTYNGGKIEPIVKASITVSGTTKTLTEGTDFTVKYYDNDKAGTAYFQIVGMGSYECDEFAPSNNTFTIEQLDLSSSYVKLEIDDATYAGYYNDASTVADGLVKLTPSYAVYYVDTTNNIKNKLQEQTDSVSGDYKVYAWNNNTKAAKSTDATAPTLTITAGNSGNIKTGTQKSGTFTINQLNLSGNEVEIAQQTAEFTGSAINVADVVKIKSGQTYTSTTTGKTNQPVYLTQKGAYSSLDAENLYDYEISVKKDGTTYGTTITEQGTYTITLTGKNSCTGSLETYFTITGRSLEDNFHYYYDYGTNPGFKGSMSSENTDAGYRYKYVGSNGTTAENLTVYVYDVETLNGTNKPTVVIYDKGRTGSTTEGYQLAESEYEVKPYNNTEASTGAWTKTNETDKNGGLHALPDASLPYIEITGQGDYTGTIKVPFNIGKNLNTVDLEITYTFDSSTELEYNSDYDNPTDSTKARHAYTYNGETQKPTVKVYLKNGTTKTKLVQDTAYTVTYVDDSGETDTSVNAGYKNIVITGMGDYCGTKSQRYSINRKEVTASASPFTTETTMQTTNGELTFTVSGLSRLTSDNAYKYLKRAGLSETEAANYVGYLYAVYDGSSIVPTVTVKDNTLGAKGTTSKPISSDDLIFKPVNDDTVSTFTSSGDQLNPTLSQYKIGFKATSATDFSTSGNYFTSASGEEVYKYSVMYIIVPGDISDTTGFTAEFATGLLGNVVPYDAGKERTPDVVVKRLNSSDILTEGEDYTLTYANNITPRKYDSSTKSWGPNATVTITGINNYSGSQTLDFYIQGKLSETKPYYYDEDGDFVQGIPTQQYSGTKITQGSPEIYLVLPAQNDQTDDYVLTYGMQYEATDGGSTDGFLREGWVEYTGLDYWNGGDAITFDYNIEYDEASITATNFKPSYEYTGYPIEPKFKLSISTATLGTITYSRSGVETTDLTSLGTITASIPYTVGSYEGTVEATYEITPRPIANCEIKLSREYPRYTGRAVEPPFTIYIESTNLQNGKTQIYRDLTEYDETTQAGDYSVDYGNYVYGDGKITFTGKSNEITGTVDKEYTIKLQNVANLMVTDTTSNSITVEWVRDIFSSGTELKLYKMNSEGKYTIARETAVEGKTSTYTFDNLSSSTNYKIEAIAYAVNGSTILESDPESTTAVTGIAVTDITVESNAAGKATVSWKASGNVIIYDIYRANDATSDGKLVAIIPATTYSYTNTKLTSGQEYYYYVKGWAVINGELKQVTESERVPITIK